MANMIGTSSTSHFVELPDVVSRLEQVKVERKQFRVWQALAAWLFGVLGILALFMLIDLSWVVPAWARSLAVPPVLGLAVYLFIRARRPYDTRHAAAEAEAFYPQLGQRLRTVLQYSDVTPAEVPASPGLLRRSAATPIDDQVRSTFGRLFPGSCSSERRLGFVSRRSPV